MNGREALEANEKAVEGVVRRFEDLATTLDRQRRAWERFDQGAKELDSDLTVAQVISQQFNWISIYFRSKNVRLHWMPVNVLGSVLRWLTKSFV